MKFDPHLARALLLELEASDEADGSTMLEIRVAGADPRVVSYHIALLAEAGLVRARESGGVWSPLRLTWDGHEALEAMRRKPLSFGHRRRSRPRAFPGGGPSRPGPQLEGGA